MNSRRAVLFSLYTLVSTTGCALNYYLRASTWEPAMGAVLANDNVTIRSVYDGWELRLGQLLLAEEGPLFAYYRTEADGGHDGFVDYHDNVAYMGCAFNGAGDELLSAYRTDMSFNIGPSNRVTIEREVSGTVESYHGLILFIPVVEGADEIAGRRWQISIPDRYFTRWNFTHPSDRVSRFYTTG